MDVGRAVFPAVALTTRGILGYAIVRAFTTVDPRVGLVFGILPGIDFLFPAA